jgi:hypothetical protein
MSLKNKRILAFTVKFIFSVSFLCAQPKQDSVIAKPVRFFLPPIHYFFLQSTIQSTQVPGDFYARQLPFFCDKELKIQKAVGFPVKFRIGSVEYCDKLEGKNQGRYVDVVQTRHP